MQREKFPYMCSDLNAIVRKDRYFVDANETKKKDCSAEKLSQLLVSVINPAIAPICFLFSLDSYIILDSYSYLNRHKKIILNAEAQAILQSCT